MSNQIAGLRFSLVVVLALLVSVQFGCDSQGDGTKVAGGRKFVTVGTAPPGGAFAPVGNAIAGVVDGNKGDLNWVITPQETKGTQQNIRQLEAGELEFGMANAAISWFATKGEGAWEKPHDIRVVTTIAPNVGIFVTTKSAGISSISELKGKRVAVSYTHLRAHETLR